MQPKTKPLYAELLERSAYNFRIGFLNTARTLAADAIDEMVPMFSPNNPKLADAYRLHARICLTHFKAAGYNPASLAEYERLAGYGPGTDVPRGLHPSDRRHGVFVDAAGLFHSWRRSSASEIEVLALGMYTDRLAQAKFDFQAIVSMAQDKSEDHHHNEAVEMKARLREMTSDEAFNALLEQLARSMKQLFDQSDAMEVGSLTG
jgi:hypothetical protein